MSRYLFRMTHYKNLQVYLREGNLWAKNSKNLQKGYRISYENIVNRRGDSFFTPCDSSINDFVPFYFSPITKMAYAIHKGNVPLKDPDGMDLGAANMDDVAYIVVDPERLFLSGRVCWFTDIACNSAIPPVYENRPHLLPTHVHWHLFDDNPITAAITEIGYKGVCKWQHDSDEPVKFQQRSKRRMAEFMVKDCLKISEISCIILKDWRHLSEVSQWVEKSGASIPVYVKPECYF